MKQIDNKNKLKLAVLTILGLLLIIVGVTYAIYEASNGGLKELIMTAIKPASQISVSYTESNIINLTNTYPMSDSDGISQTGTNSVMSFTISASGQTNYAIALDSIDEDTTLTEEFVKIYLLKGNTVVSTFTSGEGKLISDLKPYAITNEINNYALYTDNFSSQGSQEYTIKAWIDESYNLAQTDVSSGNTHGVETVSEVFKFKVKVIAADYQMAIGISEPTIENIEIKKITETAMNPTNNNIKRLSNNEYAVATATNFQDSIIDAGDKLEIKLIYSENIQGTAPTLNLTFGGIESINTPTAGVVHENTITYEYTTATADYGALDINLSGGTIANSSQISSLNVISTAVGNLIRDYAIIDRIQTFDYSGNYKKFTVQKDGYYEIELWGAQGGTIVNSSAGGKGAYTVGTLYMHKDEVYYIYVGQMQNTYNTESFNGGLASGGGATDIRCFLNENGKCVTNTNNLNWSDDLGLNSRIMVAGGGAYNGQGISSIGYGGSLTGSSGTTGTGGTQVGGGTNSSAPSTNASFGKGGTGYGGGGGYYGGAGAVNSTGGGGSSFISGYKGCVAIEKQITAGGTRTPKTINGTQCTATIAANNINCSYHYSDKIFSDTDMKSGAEVMPTHEGTNGMIGNSGNGFAKITWIEKVPTGEFDYKVKGQSYTIPKTGYYRLEVWGAEGGTSNYNGIINSGGKGGYSTGIYHFNSDDIVYVYVGGKGSDSFANDSTSTITANGLGYNGGTGANSVATNSAYGGGGGGTDIRCFSNGSGGCTSNSNDLDWNSTIGLNSRIIVAGGGGGGSSHMSTPHYSGSGGSGGGYKGVNGITSNSQYGATGTGGTQSAAGICTASNYGCRDENQGSFGYGGGININLTIDVIGGGGGGYYGGSYGYYAPGSGGSGYIGNQNLTNKHMYTYCSNSCDQYKSVAENTYTDTTTNVSATATSDYAKSGNGFAKITWYGTTLN